MRGWGAGVALILCGLSGLPSEARAQGHLGEPEFDPKTPVSAAAIHAWWSVKPEQVRTALCRRTAPFSDAEIEAGLRTLTPADDKKVTKTVGGVAFENESETLMKLFETLVGSTKFSSRCKTVLCAVKDPAIFGPRLGPRLLFMLQRFGFNGSHYRDPKSDKWSDAEMDEVLITLSDLPPNVFPSEVGRTVLPLLRFKRGRELKNPNEPRASAADATIYLTDIWRQYGRELRHAVLLHEIGHVISDRYKLSSSPEWAEFSGWSMLPGKTLNAYKFSKAATLVSTYGSVNPIEDFAESVVAYRYDPAKLKKKSLEKYNFLKETVFDGLEYTSAAACAPAASISERFVKEGQSVLDGFLKPSPARTELLTRAKRECPHFYVHLLTAELEQYDRNLAKLNDCLAKLPEQALAAESPLMSKLKYGHFIGENLKLRRAKKLKSNPASIAKSLHADLFADLKEAVTRFIRARDDGWYAELAKDPSLRLKNFCGSYAIRTYGFALQDMNARFGAKATVAQKREDVLNDIAGKVCMELYGGKPGAPLTDEQIQSFVDKLFVTQKFEVLPPAKPTPIVQPTPIPMPTPAPLPTPEVLPEPQPTAPVPTPLPVPTPVVPETTEPPPLPPPSAPVESAPVPVTTPAPESAPVSTPAVEETSPPPLPPPLPPPPAELPTPSAPAMPVETTTPPAEAAPAPAESASKPGP